MIALRSPEADELGFVPEYFDGYLWKHNKTIIICFIKSIHPRKGHFSNLLSGLWAKGYTIQIPTPLPQMLAILKAKGFHQRFEWDEEFQDYVELWERGPDA